MGRGEAMAGHISPVTIVKQGAPWWMPWAAFILGVGVGFVLGLAAVIVRAGQIQ